MAYANFKPTIWSKYIQLENAKLTVLEQCCWNKFSGEVGKGKQVKIIGAADPAIGNYTGENISLETPADTSVILDINQAKYFAFTVDDVDAAQAIDGMMEAYMTAATRAMAAARDAYIASLSVDAGDFSSSTAVTTAAGAVGLLDAALEKLYDNGVKPTDKVHAVVTPKLYRWLKRDVIEQRTTNEQALDKGVVGYYGGAAIKVSNNLYTDDTDYYSMVFSDRAIAFASGIDEVEAFRPQLKFADAVKGLNVFGGKVVRPKELYVIKSR